MSRTKGEASHEPVPKCTKKNRDGTPCKGWAMKGGTACRKHGGPSKKGKESGRFKQGMYSKAFLESELGQKITRLKSDPVSLDLYESLIFVRARYYELSDKLSSQEGEASKGIIKKIRKTYDEMVEAGLNGKHDVANYKMNKLDEIISAAEQSIGIMEEIKEIIVLEKQLTESQGKRELQLDTNMKAADMDVLLGTLIYQIKQTITARIEDKEFANELLAEIGQGFIKARGESNISRVLPAA